MTAIMLVVINSVSALVHLYSWGYMEEDPDQPRFFAYLSLFTFAMLMLVTADNLVQMFFGWEGVGLASYLLIGFWFRKPGAGAAAIKAFVVNRVGDLGFMLGIFGTFLVFGTVSIPEILAAAPGMSGSSITFVGMRLYTMDILCILLFIGAMGKSAQLGLHTWLPDAMEGPTPVSALIHAATMVTAGVFMLCRLSPMFEAAPTALAIVTVVGAATCFFAATIGTTQWDIKRVIAYSTCSQLGYMFFAAGVGAYGVAMFHLFTHAFFKALLFLGAGSVIHAMHHEQDMRYYGGLRKHIPLTFYAMLAGTLAITGLGVYHLGVGFAGFWSKDAVLEVAFARGTQISVMSFWLGVTAALLTSFYSWRLMFLTFWGRPRWIDSEHIQHAVHKTPEQAGEDTTGGYHPHESPLPMLVPLGVLTIGAVAAGQGFAPAFLDSAAFWAGSIFYNEPLIHAMHAVPYWVKYSAFVVMVLGFVGAYVAYIAKPDIPAKFVATFGALHQFVYRKWYFDELYDMVFVKPAFALGKLFWQAGDVGLIDRFGPNGVADAVSRGAVAAKRMQTGYLNTYALIMLLGLIAAITFVLF
jgi:NADH-quinone oxidoreductase subunit L